MDDENRIRYAIEHTEVLRPPRQGLATFGISNIYYYLVTEPVYAELVDSVNETVVREGWVIVERPKIVTPSYLINLFEGFEHGRQFADHILREYGPHEPGLLYRYRNEPKETTIVTHPLETMVHKLEEKLDREKENLAAIVRGVDELWDVSLMKFIHDLTRDSLSSSVMELGRRGLLDIDRAGIPRDARGGIEELFDQVKRGEAEPYELEIELHRWSLFGEYEDRFLRLFRKR